MKVLKVIKQTDHDHDKHRYTFSCLLFFILPVTMVCDWSGKGFMTREYCFFNKLILKKKHETKTWTPKMPC